MLSYVTLLRLAFMHQRADSVLKESLVSLVRDSN